MSQSFHFILYGVAVHDVHDDREAVGMRFVDELLQVFRRPKAGRGGKEAAHVITERTVIRMFLYGHDLDGIVSFLHDARQDFLAELVVRAYFFFVRAHADMAFVNHEGSGIGFEFLYLEFVGFFRIPDLRAEDFRLRVLHHAPDPCRNTFAASAFPFDPKFEQIPVV